MNIMVIDVPATSGGALSILQEFHAEVLANDDKINKWVFVVSTPQLRQTENVKVLNYPWIKKSWLHRLYFDCFVAPQLVKSYQIDRVFSLQNLVVPRTSVPQVVYVHQPLPFVEHRFRFAEDPKLWFYQNVLSRAIFWSMRRAQKVIVQTEWLRLQGSNKSGSPKEKIHVVRPSVNAAVITAYQNNDNSRKTFFYPASSILYKNHSVAIKACEVLKEQGVHDYRVIFTLTGKEDNHISLLYQRAQQQGLPVRFAGPMQRAEVFQQYQKAVLLFPSYVETFGLPLLEAALHGSPVIAAGTMISREVLGGYPNAHFFDYSDPSELAEIMRKMIMGEIEHVPNMSTSLRLGTETLLNHVLS